MEPQTELLAHKEDKTMYELNKTAFGSFLAQLRAEKFLNSVWGVRV